jgi:hypothetical protein
MSAPIIEFPRVEHAAARPEKPVWTESMKLHEGITMGIDAYSDGLFVMWRKIGTVEHSIACPSLSVAATMLMHAFFDFYNSVEADEFTGAELEAAQDELCDLLAQLRPFDEVLTEANFPPFDEAVKLLKK